MKRLQWMAIGAVLALAGSGTALAGSVAGGESADRPACSTEGVRGTYGLYGTGFLLGSPFSIVGTATFDGRGKHTGRAIESVNGTIDDSHYEGTYEVRPDCTGSTVIDMHHETRFDGHVVDFVVTAGGQRGLWILRDSESRQLPDGPDADDTTFTISGVLERL